VISLFSARLAIAVMEQMPGILPGTTI